MPSFGKNDSNNNCDIDGVEYTLHNDVRESCDLAFSWKRKVRLKRAVDALCSPRDELGLRLSRETSLPSLTDLVCSGNQGGGEEEGEY